jgi:NADPH:quinone reductase-like Zn-dependent oxidoreductase
LRVHAVSLNFRDVMVVHGWYPLATDRPIVPASDAACEVLAVGAKVTRVKQGDRVVTAFFPGWIEGAVAGEKLVGALGGGGDGVLSEEIVLPESGVVLAPPHLTYEEAATLSCAGVTAWNALFIAGAIKPGSNVLLLGTGGVSIWALQLAKAAGARVIITSSSDDKLERARGVGADDTINYRTTPDWASEAKRLTGGVGVDVVLEVGGEKTVGSSLASTKVGGTVVIIGAVSGPGGAINPMMLIAASTRVQGIYVGSRAMLEDLARFVATAGIRPVVDRVFPFTQAPAAYAHFQAAQHFGKVVIRVAGP